MKIYLISAMLAMSLSGCVSLSGSKNTSVIVTYLLADAGHAAPVAATNPRTLLLLDTATSAFYNTESMAFSRTPGTRGLYRYARWTERPGKRIGDLLLARLESGRAFSTVASTGSGVKGDWVLDTELQEFYHQAGVAPGSAHLEMRAEVVDLRNRRLVARQRFEQQVPASAYNAAGAADAFNVATTRLLDEMESWLQTLPHNDPDSLPQ